MYIELLKIMKILIIRLLLMKITLVVAYCLILIRLMLFLLNIFLYKFKIIDVLIKKGGLANVILVLNLRQQKII